jgi:two-component system, cell cycle response regulator
MTVVRPESRWNLNKISCKTSLRTDGLDERRPLRILLVESNEEDEKRFREAVKSALVGEEVVKHNSVRQALESENLADFDIAVIGDSSDQISLLESVALFNESNPSLPQIILTRIADEQIAQASIDVGAQDYLIKPLTAESSLQERMLYAIARHAMIVSDRVVMQELRATSQLDGLTKLFNRAAFDRESERQVAIANRNGTPLSIGMIDVDFFKTINDKYGHMVGDEVLVALGEILTSASRVSDIPCRFGGEEFCVILPDTDDEQSFIWAERVCRTIRETKIATRQGPLSITASIGTATLVRGATSIDAALEQADAGCIEAKSRGRDQVVVMTAATALNTTQDQSQNSMLENVRASDVMSTILMTIPRSTTVASAARLMLECQCEAIPVVTSEGTLRGLLTNEEIVSHILRKGNWEDEIDSIAGQTVTFTEDTPFDKVWGVFQRLPIRRAVVTQNEKPIGVINRGQLLRRLAATLELDETPSSSDASQMQKSSLHQIFDEIKQTADDYLLRSKTNTENDQQDMALIVAASQLQDLASQLLQLASPGKGQTFGIATCSAASLVNL